MKKLIVIIIIISYIVHSTSYIVGEVRSTNDDIRTNALRPMAIHLSKAQPQLRVILSADGMSQTLSSNDVYEAKAFRCSDSATDDNFWVTTENGAGHIPYIDHFTRNILAFEIRELFPDNALVLDLMSGRESFLCKELPRSMIHGVGLSVTALMQNEDLNTYQVFDINKNPYFTTRQKYDIVMISLGVPYMTKPLEVFRSIYNVLKPRGKLIIFCANTFYFPERATDIWRHPRRYGYDDQLTLTIDFLENSEGYSVNVFRDEEAVDGILECLVGFSKLGKRSGFILVAEKNDVLENTDRAFCMPRNIVSEIAGAA